MAEWIEIEGGRYKLGSNGRIRTMIHNKGRMPGYYLRPCISKGRQAHVSLRSGKNGKPRSRTIASLVRDHFGPVSIVFDQDWLNREIEWIEKENEKYKMPGTARTRRKQRQREENKLYRGDDPLGEPKQPNRTCRRCKKHKCGANYWCDKCKITMRRREEGF